MGTRMQHLLLQEGLVSSGADTSLNYVHPKGSKAKISCKGWYMIVVAFANAIAGIFQRGILAQKLKAARCF